MKIPISPKNSSKICIFKILINKNKKKGPNFIFIFIFYLTCFTTVPIFKSIGSLVAEIWGGGGGQNAKWIRVKEYAIYGNKCVKNVLSLCATLIPQLMSF